MGYQPDVPGPGEDGGPADVPTEPANVPVQFGEQAASAYQRDWRRSTHELAPWRASEPDDRPESCGINSLRRTGTDHLVVSLSAEGSTENRSDHSASDGMREQSFDPTQDDTGLQPD